LIAHKCECRQVNDSSFDWQRDVTGFQGPATVGGI
jgi:hypothetical protein